MNNNDPKKLKLERGGFFFSRLKREKLERYKFKSANLVKNWWKIPFLHPPIKYRHIGLTQIQE